MELPYLEPLTPRPLADPVIPEPPRRGEPGGEECGICTHQATPAVWESEHFTMHPPVQGSLPGAVWLASKEHVDSFNDLLAGCGGRVRAVVARVEQAILALGDVGRVICTAGATGARTSTYGSCLGRSGMLQASGTMLPIWEDVLPNVPDEELAEAARQIAAAL